MYEQFYDLNENPFNITSDPAFFFTSKNHEEAVAHLLYGIERRKGIMSLTGEVGTGKTTLCRALLNQLPSQTKTALILNPNFPPTQLVQMIVEDFGLKPQKNDKLHLINTLNEFLLKETDAGHNVLISIDEAQNLNVAQLEQIRLLSNLETEKHKLLQIILIGQPELNDKLKDNALRQLNQRINVRYHINPIELDEVGKYVDHRLRVAGSDGKLTFTREALEVIYEYSHGTPRMINLICERALLAGFVQEAWSISPELVHRSAQELASNFSAQPRAREEVTR